MICYLKLIVTILKVKEINLKLLVKSSLNFHLNAECLSHLVATAQVESRTRYMVR